MSYTYSTWEQGKKTIESIYIGDFPEGTLPQGQYWGHTDYLYDSNNVIHQELHYYGSTTTTPSYIRDFDSQGRVTKESSGPGSSYNLYTYGDGYSQKTNYNGDGSYYGLTIRTYNLEGADRHLQFQDPKLDAQLAKDQVLSGIFKDMITLATSNNKTLDTMFLNGFEMTEQGYVIKSSAWGKS